MLKATPNIIFRRLFAHPPQMGMPKLLPFTSPLPPVTSRSFSSNTKSFSFANSLSSFFKFRLERLYHTFYYAQYSNKYVLVLLFPALMFYVRFKNDTKLYYRVYLPSSSSNEEGDPTHYTYLMEALASKEEEVGSPKKRNGELSASNGGKGGVGVEAGGSNGLIGGVLSASSSESSAGNLPLSPPVRKGGDLPMMAWSNGKKFYMKDDATVEDLMGEVWGGKKNIPQNVVAFCRGRVLEGEDNLSVAVKTYCRRDPKIFMWRDTGAC